MTEAERQFEQRASLQRWQVCHRGWPDYWCITPHGMCFVEVKSFAREQLRAEQDALHSQLAKHGIPCYRWDPEAGLTHLSGPRLMEENSVMREWLGEPHEAKMQRGIPLDDARVGCFEFDEEQSNLILQRDVQLAARRARRGHTGRSRR